MPETEIRSELARLMGRVTTEFAEPVELSSGRRSRWFVDARRAMSYGFNLQMAARGIMLEAQAAGLSYRCVGGPASGADPLAAAVALLSECYWFSVRRERKGRGTDRLIEGVEFSPGSPVLLVDDVATSGGSLCRAADAAEAEGAEVLAACVLVDRGGGAEQAMAERGLPYLPLVTCAELGVPPLLEET